MSTSISGAGVKRRKASSRHAGSHIQPGAELAREAKALHDRSAPQLVASIPPISKLPGQPKSFATQPGKSPGLYLDAIARGTPGATIRTNRVTPGMEGYKSAVMSAGDVGPTLQRSFNRIANFDLRGQAKQGKARQSMGRLIGINQAIATGNRAAYDLISGRAPQVNDDGYRATLQPSDHSYAGSGDSVIGPLDWLRSVNAAVALHPHAARPRSVPPFEPPAEPSAKTVDDVRKLLSGTGRRSKKGLAV